MTHPYRPRSRQPLPLAGRLSCLLLATWLLGSCTSVPVADIRRAQALPESGIAGTAASRSADPVDARAGIEPIVEPLAADGPRAQVRRGTGEVINRAAAAAPRPGLGATSGEATFNFEGESVHAVVKAILGDMLGQNYVIAPDVQGTVTLATPRPVSPAEAISLLEQVLGWSDARMVYTDGRYNIVPAERALPGNVAPRTGSAAGARGFEVRTVPLRYVAAEEMRKILEPYARPDAIVGTDNARNVISIGGSATELENYLRTIEIFDVDWLAGMSVGVFPLETGRAAQVVQDLEQVFGEEAESPVSGMFRFMPIEGANAVMVITPQAEYLDHVRQWLERIDGAGAGVRLYTHELKYIRARDLANRLAEVFGGAGPEEEPGTDGRGGPSLMPGSRAMELSSDGGSARDGLSSGRGGVRGGSRMGGGTGGSGVEGELALDERVDGNASARLRVQGDPVGVSAVEETNSLLVRTTPRAWKSIREVIDQLDVMPMQVHIEAQVLEVQLSGALEYGVNWFFERAVTDAGLPSARGRDTWSTLAGSVQSARGDPAGLSWTFLGRDAAAVVSALDEVTDINMLQTPSVVVRNNAEATFNVGSSIPIASVSVNPGLGSDSTYSQVEYIDTGVILKVRPRVTRDGLVFLEIVQEVSSPGAVADALGNVRIDTRRLKTEAAISSGETVMLAGLIRDSVARGSSGFPGLSRIPVIGGLFGTQSSETRREETVVLLTPTIVRNPMEARNLTDEYGRRFRALEPLHRGQP
ncbi:type II secretion system secretin GspD [Novilysobacter defluvii]|nr:type II secretion system secretin GspD [Lysobacter defluvii]